MPVTADERETYLRPPFDGTRRDFYDAIRGRPATLPRRSWWRSQRVTLASIPIGFGWGLVLLGATFLWRGAGFEGPLRWLMFTAGPMGLTYGAFILAIRLSLGGARPQPEVPPLTPDEKRIKCRRFE